MKSAFDDQEQYVLTELGKQFVHYTMTDLVKRIGSGPIYISMMPITKPEAK